MGFGGFADISERTIRPMPSGAPGSPALLQFGTVVTFDTAREIPGAGCSASVPNAARQAELKVSAAPLLPFFFSANLHAILPDPLTSLIFRLDHAHCSWREVFGGRFFVGETERRRRSTNAASRLGSMRVILPL